MQISLLRRCRRLQEQQSKWSSKRVDWRYNASPCLLHTACGMPSKINSVKFEIRFAWALACAIFHSDTSGHKPCWRFIFNLASFQTGGCPRRGRWCPRVASCKESPAGKAATYSSLQLLHCTTKLHISCVCARGLATLQGALTKIWLAQLSGSWSAAAAR